MRSVERAAGAFLRASGCPERLVAVTALAKVTKGNRPQMVRRVVTQSLFPTGTNGRCDSVRGLGAASNSSRAKLRSLINARLSAGDRIVKVDWKSGRAKRTTLAVVGRGGGVKFEPQMSTYGKPGSAETPDSPGALVSAMSPGVAGQGVSWVPWSKVGEHCVVRNGLGVCVVGKYVNMRIYVDQNGRITDHTQIVTVSDSAFFDAARRIKTELVTRGGVQCIKLTVQTYWAGVLGSISTSAGTGGFDVDLSVSGWGARGMDEQVYTLCADGSCDYMN